MGIFIPILNNSVRLEHTFISNAEMQIIFVVNVVILCGVISAFGLIANAINMVVFYRQGLDTTINISFFSLAVSDLCSLVLQQMFNVFLNPLFHSLHLPISYLELQYLTTGVPRAMFTRITCLITAFITAERCLSVVLPLHVKQMITPRLSSAVMITIFMFTLLSLVPIYCTSYYTWKFYPDLNTTLVGLTFTEHNDITEAIGYFSHGFFMIVGFLSVLTFTLILICKLGQKNAWRETANFDQEKVKSMSKRDRATITMVVVIAGILVVCYTPAALLGLTTFLVLGFSMKGRYHNLYCCLWSVAIFCENFNSTINIFLYYQMSSRYRHTFRELFSKCLHTGNKEIVSFCSQQEQ